MLETMAPATADGSGLPPPTISSHIERFVTVASGRMTPTAMRKEFHEMLAFCAAEGAWQDAFKVYGAMLQCRVPPEDMTYKVRPACPAVVAGWGQLTLRLCVARPRASPPVHDCRLQARDASQLCGRCGCPCRDAAAGSPVESHHVQPRHRRVQTVGGMASGLDSVPGDGRGWVPAVDRDVPSVRGSVRQGTHRRRARCVGVGGGSSSPWRGTPSPLRCHQVCRHEIQRSPRTTFVSCGDVGLW